MTSVFKCILRWSQCFERAIYPLSPKSFSGGEGERMAVGAEGCFDDGLQPMTVTGWHFLVGRVTV